MYVLINSDHEIVSFPYAISQLKKDNPLTSFPKTFTEQILNSHNMYSVQVLPCLPHDPTTHTSSLETSPYLVDGVWSIGWNIVELTEEQKLNNSAFLASDIRIKRNSMLASSDWTQLADAPLTASQKTDWVNYRQALRDITEQENFPDNVEWPSLVN